MQKHIHVKLWGVFKAFMCIQIIEKNIDQAFRD